MKLSKNKNITLSKVKIQQFSIVTSVLVKKKSSESLLKIVIKYLGLKTLKNTRENITN